MPEVARIRLREAGDRVRKQVGAAGTPALPTGARYRPAGADTPRTCTELGVPSTLV